MHTASLESAHPKTFIGELIRVVMSSNLFFFWCSLLFPSKTKPDFFLFFSSNLRSSGYPHSGILNIRPSIFETIHVQKFELVYCYIVANS